MEEELLRFASMLDVKDKLLRLEKEELVEEYSNIDRYNFFVDGVLGLVEDDREFFSFTVLREEVVEVLAIYRFNKNLDKSLLEKINKIITNFNLLENINPEDAIFAYCEKQILQRGLIFKDLSTLVESFTYDIDVFISILDDSLESFEDERFVLASLYYFGYAFRSMYEDEEIRQIVLKYLENVKLKKGLFRGKIKTYAKGIDKKFFQEAE